METHHVRCTDRHSVLVSFPFLLEKENRGLENHWRLLRLSVASFLTLRVSFFAYCSKMTLSQGALTHVCKVSSGLFRIRNSRGGWLSRFPLECLPWILQFCPSLPPLMESPREDLELWDEARGPQWGQSEGQCRNHFLCRESDHYVCCQDIFGSWISMKDLEKDLSFCW